MATFAAKPYSRHARGLGLVGALALLGFSLGIPAPAHAAPDVPDLPAALTPTAVEPPPSFNPLVPVQQPFELGGWVGPRIINDNALLGYIGDAPAHPQLGNLIVLGLRVGVALGSHLMPEIELPISFGSTTTFPTSVFWFAPRAQLRFEILPGARFRPFVLAGAGVTMAFSSNSKVFANDQLGDGYLGAGFEFAIRRGLNLRFDARLSFDPGENPQIVTEYEFGFGLSFAFGGARPVSHIALSPTADTDGDGIPDSLDQCPDRAEDKDGFEDADGCPDIDNDGDGVLDIDDKCPLTKETYNGFEDEDGCPDTVPADVTAIRGTIPGLLYATGETEVRDSALPAVAKIAEILKKYPSVKIVLDGFTDDREAIPEADAAADAKPAKPASAADEAAPSLDGTAPEAAASSGPAAPSADDLDAMSKELGRTRANEVRNALIADGVTPGRITVRGRGAEEPVSENDTPRGRLANRRVALQLLVPER